MNSTRASLVFRTWCLCVFVVSLLQSPLVAQTIFRDTVRLRPTLKPPLSPLGVTVDPKGFFLSTGGALSVRFTWPNAFVGPGDWVMKRSGVQLVRTGDLSPDGTEFPYISAYAPIGSYGQWSYLELSMKNDSIPQYVGSTYYMDDNSNGIVGTGFPGFLFYRVLDSTPDYDADIVAEVSLQPDSSSEAYPPQAAYDQLFTSWNPYERDPYAVMEVLIPGEYRLIIKESNTGGIDDVRMLLPRDTILITDAVAHMGDTVMIGSFGEGDLIELGIINRASALLSGQTLYGSVFQVSPIAWEITFEDWTDLDFNDLTLRVELDVGPTDHMELWSASNTIWYGDTVDVQITPADVEGEFSPLGPDNQYEYSIELPDSLQQYGELIYRGDPGYLFENIPLFNGVGSDLQFAANGVEPESTVVLSFHLKATYLGDIIISAARKGPEPVMAGSLPPSPYSLLPSPLLASDPPEPGDVVKDNYWGLDNSVPKEILLGQTIYLQAVEEPNYLKRLFFNPLTKPGEKHDPELPGVTFTVTNGQGDKLGIYYEHKDADGNTLRQDILRTIGRYWKPVNQENDRYIVTITATAGERTGEIKLEVKKPARLGTTYNLIDDVKSVSFNLDDTLIVYAGRHGIPPQMIKGQIEKETQPHFTPSYRYEPFLDLSIQRNEKEKRRFMGAGFPFIVTRNPDDMGGDFPIGHNNVTPIQYPITPDTLADFLGSHFEQYVKLAERTVIGDPKYARRLTERLQYWYDEFLRWDNATEIDSITLARAARTRLSSELLEGALRQDYLEIAQTRIMSSYGFVQMLYRTATRDAFEETNNLYGSPGSTYLDRGTIVQMPELLNEYEFLFPRYVDFTLKHLRRSLNTPKPGFLPGFNWTGGYEKVWTATFQKHNKGEPGYGQAVLANGKSYLPLKSQVQP